jgi:Tol biopolymer transport system component
VAIAMKKVKESLLVLAGVIGFCRPVVAQQQQQQPNAAARAAERLVEQIRRNPAEPSTAAGRIGLYVIDVVSGEVTLAASEPNPGNCQCGSGAWSRDGKRIYFDATTGDSDPMRHLRSRLKVLDLEGGRPRVTDLGHGNCPTPSPAGDQVIFLISPVYSPETNTCVFVGEQEGKGLALYSIQRDKPGPPRRLEAEGFDNLLQSLTFSPGGRFVAFSSERPDRRKADNPPAGRRP